MARRQGALDDFWELYKNDSILSKIQSSRLAIVLESAILIVLFFFQWLLQISLPSIDSAIALLLMNLGFPISYYFMGYRQPFHICALETWDRRYPSKKHDERPTIRTTLTVVRVLVKLKPHPDWWRIRIETPSYIEARAHEREWVKDWIASVQQDSLLVSCSNGHSFFDFSMHVEMKQLPPCVGRSCEVSYFYSSDRCQQEVLALRKRIWLEP